MNPHASSARSRSIQRSAPRAFIEDKTIILVRFNEVDSLHIVWHGHYANYFEEGRRAFGRRLGIDYPTFIEQRIAVPVIRLELNFLTPARLADTLVVTTRLLKSDSARLDFDYEIRRETGDALLATGNTSQVFTTPAGELILNWPPFMLERLESWKTLWKLP
jgi:acyl-CoA thioester hydrolase